VAQDNDDALRQLVDILTPQWEPILPWIWFGSQYTAQYLPGSRESMMDTVIHFLDTYTQGPLFTIVLANPTATLEFALKLWYDKRGGGSLIDVTSSSFTSVAPVLERCLGVERSAQTLCDILQSPSRANSLFQGFTLRLALLGGLIAHEQVDFAYWKRLADSYSDIVTAVIQRNPAIWTRVLASCTVSGFLQCLLEVLRLPDTNTTSWVLSHVQFMFEAVESGTERLLPKLTALVEGQVFLALHFCLSKHATGTREFNLAGDILESLGCYLPYPAIVKAISRYGGDTLLKIQSPGADVWDVFISCLERCKQTLDRHDEGCLRTCCDSLKVRRTTSAPFCQKEKEKKEKTDLRVDIA
jgi:hypothetical protein